MTPPADTPDPDAALQTAMRAHRDGDLQRAEAACRRILDADPGHADALHLLGAIALQSGRADDAADLIRRSLAANDRNPDAHANLGAALLRLGRVPDAMAALNRALAIDPDHADAHYNAGLVLLEAGEPDQARQAFAAVLRAQPDRPDAVMKLGVALMRLDRTEEGLAALRRAAALAPGEPSVHYNLAVALLRQGLPDEAEDHLLRIGGDAARAPEVAYALGQVNAERGDPEGAAELFRAALAADPDNAAAHIALGKQLMDLGDLVEAEAHMRRARALQPETPEIRCNLGLIADALGRHDEAVSLFRGAGEPGLVCLAESHIGRGGFDLAAAAIDDLEAGNPDHPCVFSLRAQIGRAGSDGAGRRRAEAVAEQGRGDPSDVADLLLALGRSYEDEGAFDRAFDYFRRGNELLNARIRYDAAGEERAVDDLIATFAPTLFESAAGSGGDSEVPVFVVGMPRSGTSLVEQIVASHPKAAGAGELVDMPRIRSRLARAIGSDRPFPACAAELDGEAARRLAGDYLTRLLPVAPDALRIVDKLPHNFLCLGLIALLLPRARIVHCRRDPLDTCLSIYQHRFSGAHPYAYALDRLGHAFRQYARLMEHWRAVLPSPMHEIAYERLIANPEQESRALIAFLGLDWDDACLAFHETERTVRTPSAWQVRQPIYAGAVEKWRNYETHLGPLIDALAGR